MTGKTLKQLIDTLPQHGEVVWIGIRPARKAAMSSIQTLDASVESGLGGDRYSRNGGKRQVTLIQQEHLAVIGSVLGREPVDPGLLRRNLVVEGINLLALKNKDIEIGSVVLRVTGLCHPCSRMEAILGEGGYNAVRGHGGITASILSGGRIDVGDRVKVADIGARET